MNIFFDEDAKQINVLDERFYESLKNKGAYYPSVTTILEAYNKGYGFNEWLKQVGYNAEIIAEKAATQGSNVHNMIENYLKGLEIIWEFDGKALYTLTEWRMFCKFIDFFETYKPDVLAIEYKFCNETLGFGGTIDLICKIDGKIFLIDHKTSNYLHKSGELQISAYCTAWNSLNPNYTIEKHGILWLNSATRGVDKTGKKIQGKGWQLKEYDRSYEDAFKLFEHTQAIWKEENPNYKPKNQTYPSSFKLNENLK